MAISIKPADGMEKMKYDMAGGATMIGVMRAIALLKPKVKVIGIVCATENMPSGKAQKPGDVQIAMSGKSIEIINTDAEGRLVLADGLITRANSDARTWSTPQRSPGRWWSRSDITMPASLPMTTTSTTASTQPLPKPGKKCGACRWTTNTKSRSGLQSRTSSTPAGVGEAQSLLPCF